MIRLVCLGGTGDAYLVCALANAVSAQYGVEVGVVVKARQSAIPEMFGLRYESDDEEVAWAETDRALQSTHHNRITDGGAFYAHPCFIDSGVRIDDLTTLPGPISQADMYRALMGLPIDAPLALPKLPIVEPRPNTAVLITDAVSWPNDQSAFWERLVSELRAGGWSVEVPGPGPFLVDLLALAASAEMVVGPQCGVMSIIVAAEFPCRKVITAPSIDDGPGFPVGRTLLRKTYPYAYVTKFTGHDYDVEEYRITAENHAMIAETVLALPRTPRDPRPVTTVAMPLTPGDFLDRLAVLAVKASRGMTVVREYSRYIEALPPEWIDMANDLVDLHERVFDLLEVAVPDALANQEQDDHVAVTLNKTRIELKRRIDEELRAPYREMKSYY